MPGRGQDHSDAWMARRGLSSWGQPLSADGTAQRRPGQSYMVPNNQWGAPEGWIDNQEFEEKYNVGWTPKQILAASLPLALGGAQGLASLGGGSAAATSASSGIPSLSAAGGIPAGAFPTVAGTGGASSMGLGSLGSIFKGKLDPTALVLGGLSAFVGDDGGSDPRQSFHKGVSPAAGALVDPIQSLYNALNAADRLGQFLNTRLSNGYNLRSSVVQPGPAPVNIPGLGFQIGGGLGTDPAFLDPSLLRTAPQEGPPAYTSVNTPPGGGGPAVSRSSQPARRRPQ